MLDVVIFCEGTYPYVAGGVSSWIHMLVKGMPDLKFGLVYLAPCRDFERKLKFQLPDNVVEMVEVYLYDVVQIKGVKTSTVGRDDREAAWAAARRFFTGIVEGHALDFDEIFKHLVPSPDKPAALSVADMAFSKRSWDIMLDLYQSRAPDFPFTDFFWNWRFICFPLLQLLHAPVPPARVYHTVTTGWSGLLGVVAKLKSGRPLLLTEHGIYTNERRIEIVKANWLFVERSEGRNVKDFGVLKSMWINLFSSLGMLCYLQSDKIYTLFNGNRKLQLAAGAPDEKIVILPNGVRIDPSAQRTRTRKMGDPFRIGFVGRVVPIKDVKTLIQACNIVVASLPHTEIFIIGPTEEDEDYFHECQSLTSTLGLEQNLRFLGPQNVKEWYPNLDVQVLTSVSEGQPLVILEGFCYALPCVSTDVGACSELILGREGPDAACGPAGLITRVGAPSDTAAALLQLASDPEKAEAMGRAGQQRVKEFYDLEDLLKGYHDIYTEAMKV